MLIAERVKHVNWIKGLLFSQGVSDHEVLSRDRRQRLDDLTTCDGRPLPTHLKTPISSNCGLIKSRWRRPNGTPCSPCNRPPHQHRRGNCCTSSGASVPSSPPASGWRRYFATSTITVSSRLSRAWADALAKRIGRSRAGRFQRRESAIAHHSHPARLAMARHQPQSALALWFKEQVSCNGGRLKKTTIVALARKLLVARWKYVTAGVVIEGAVMKAA